VVFHVEALRLPRNDRDSRVVVEPCAIYYADAVSRHGDRTLEPIPFEESGHYVHHEYPRAEVTALSPYTTPALLIQKFVTDLYHFRYPVGSVQLQQAGYGAHHLPLAPDVLLTERVEEAKPAYFLVLPKRVWTIALAILYTARPSSVWRLSHIASFYDSLPGGESVLISITSPRLSQPVAMYRPVFCTDASVTFASLK